MCLKDTKQKKKKKPFKNMYMYVYTHIPIYLSIHDLNEIQDLRMVPFRGKIQAFNSLLKNRDSVRQWPASKIGDEISSNIFYFPACTDLQ